MHGLHIVIIPLCYCRECVLQTQAPSAFTNLTRLPRCDKGCGTWLGN